MFEDFTKKNDERGFVILFAVVVSALLVLMMAGMFSLANKEAILTSMDTESIKAFYVADTGMECALNDYYNPADGNNANGLFDGHMPCLNTDYLVPDRSRSKASVVIWPNGRSFGEACATVVADNSVSRVVDGTRKDTVEIISRGFSSCHTGDSVFPFNRKDPRIVERRLRAWFPKNIIINNI